MTRTPRITAAARRALRLEAWGNGPAAVGFCDGRVPVVGRLGRQHVHAAYQLGLAQWREQETASRVLRTVPRPTA